MSRADYTFENYITTSSNRLARLAAEKVCESPGTQFNPLYIYGSPGVGKTHLLYAIAKEYESKGLTALCLSSNQFFEEMIEAIRNGTNAEFREKFYQVDVLLIDRLQYAAGKEATQEELFNIVEKRHLNCKQTIFVGNASLTQIPGLNPELSAYLKGGLCVEIPTSDFEGKAEIIARKLKQNGIDWPIEACRYVSLNITSGANQIEGEINKILACKELF